MIDDGYIKASGDVDKVANQYSLDNLQTEISAGDKPETKETLINSLEVRVLSEQQILPSDEITFEVSYQVKKDIKTYIAFSLTEVDRNIWIYNDNSLNHLSEGKGLKVKYTCKLNNVNDLKLKLQVSVRSEKMT